MFRFLFRVFDGLLRINSIYFGGNFGLHTCCPKKSFGRSQKEKVGLADVPLYRHFLQKVFPCNATLAEERWDFWHSWAPRTERGPIRQTRPFIKPPFCFRLNDSLRSIFSNLEGIWDPPNSPEKEDFLEEFVKESMTCIHASDASNIRWMAQGCISSQKVMQLHQIEGTTRPDLTSTIDAVIVLGRSKTDSNVFKGHLRTEIHPEEMQNSEENLLSVIFSLAILGPEMVAPILWGPDIFVLSAGENLHAHKVLFFCWRGGILMGAGIFLKNGPCLFHRSTRRNRTSCKKLKYLRQRCFWSGVCMPSQTSPPPKNNSM